ncbi:gag-pol polyprotein [Tanacetum coccineum]
MHQHQSFTSKPGFSLQTIDTKAKEIAQPITPPLMSASEEDSDPEQAQKDKDMQKKFELSLQKLEAHYSYMAKIQEVPNADSGTDAEPLEQVQYDTDNNVFANDIQHFDQSESISNKCAVETGDNNVTPDSPDMCDNDIQIAHKTYDSRPQPRSNQMKDKVVPNTSHVKFKKTKVEEHPRISHISKQTKSVTACNDSLNSRTLNVNAVCATCGKCVFNLNHDACVLRVFESVNAELRSLHARLYNSSYSLLGLGALKHMGANLSLLCNFVEKYLGTIRFGNDQFAPILGYGDLVQGNITIKRVYYVGGLNHKLFSVGQFCDADLEVAFRKSMYFVRDLQGNELLIGNHGTDLYTISLQETTSSTPICLINLQAPIISVHTDRGTEFLNKTLNAFLKEEGIKHQTSTPRTPEQNGIVERRNHTLVEAALTMLLASKLPLFFWAEAIATKCYTQNISIIIPTHEKTAYHIINDKKPSIKHLHIFGCTCYLTRDGENLDKMKEKGDPCILVGYSTQSKGYRVYNKRTRLIVESIHIRFNEIKEMSETFVANDTSSLNTTVPSQQELDLLFGPLYDEFFNDGTSRVNKSSSPTDNSIQKDTLPSTHIQPTSEPTTPTNVHAEENNDNQAEFTNPFCTPVQENAESSSRNIGTSNMHTFNQPQDSEYRWTKDHPLTHVRDCPIIRLVDTRKRTAGGLSVPRAEYPIGDMFTKALPEEGFGISQTQWYEMFDSAELEVLTK